VSAHTVRGAGLAALLLPLALFTVPASAWAQATTPRWHTYVGGSDVESFFALAQDPVTQHIVAVGVTASPDLSPANRSPAAPADVLVSIFTRAGVLGPLARPRHVVFGGSDFDQATAVAIGPNRQIYVVGRTRSPTMPSFPVVHRSHGGDFDAFVAELSPEGEPRWFMYLGAIGSDAALGVAAVGTSLYLTGNTSSSATVSSLAGIGYSTPEAFVARLDTSTSPPQFQWNQTLVGEGIDELSGITLDAAGNLYVVGTLTSPQFPDASITNSFYGGSSDAVALKLSPTGEILWLTYVGGLARDMGHAVALAPNGEVVVAGALESPGNGSNVLVARLNSAGLEQERRSLGGSKEDVARSVAVDANGNLYVGGLIGSASLPARGGFDPMFEGLSEGFVTMIPASGGPGWASYVGGDVEDRVNALILSSQNRLLLAGMTQSTSGLPGQEGYDLTFGGGFDGFIVAVDPDTTPPAAGRVYDRPGPDEVHQDVSQQASLTTLSANWEGFSDTESGVVEYEWAIGTEASPEGVKAFAPVGTATSATVKDLTLAEGTAYFVTVRAINGAGLITTARSNGVTVTVPREDEGDDPNPVGWTCATSADASLPILLGVLALALRRRRSGA
jgi:hypothetical protein